MWPDCTPALKFLRAREKQRSYGAKTRRKRLIHSPPSAWEGLAWMGSRVPVTVLFVFLVSKAFDTDWNKLRDALLPMSTLAVPNKTLLSAVTPWNFGP